MSTPLVQPRRLTAAWAIVALLAGLLAGASGAAVPPVAAANPVTPAAPRLFATGTTPAKPRTVSPDDSPTAAAGFSDSVVFDDLDDPTVVRFAADGVVFVALKSGLIVDFTSTASDTPHTFADLSSEVDDYWDRGLLGMALAPNFPTDPSVYVMYAYDHNPVSDLGNPAWDAPTQWDDACPYPPGADNDGCPIEGRISRLTATSDGSGGYVSAGGETVLVTDDCQQFPSHSVGDLVFGPDGYLYASMGEGASFLTNAQDYGQYGGTLTDSNGLPVTPANPCGDPTTPVGTAPSVPTAEGGALRAQSVRRTDGPVVLGGTLMRLQTSGAGAPGNPFAGNADPNATRILAYGFRNPFRFTFKPGTSDVWLGDVGFSTWEEVDRVSVPNSAGTANYGWPCVEGPDVGNYYSTDALNLCSGITSATTVDPYYDYNHSDAVVSGDGCSSSAGSVISAVGFYSGAAYPSQFHGALFFGDHSRDCIWAMLPGGNGLPDPNDVVNVLSGTAGGNCLACPVDLESGPNGDLFYVDFDGGTIDEISYATPQAVIHSDVISGAAPLTVHFDGTASQTGAPPLSYSWDLDGNGTFGDSTSATPSKTYGDGTYQVRLRVTDVNGATNTSAPYPITAGDTPPTPTITLIDGAAPPPQPTLDGSGNPPPVRPGGIPAVYSVGQAISFAGSATDAEQGTLPAADLSWDVRIYHCPQAGCHTHDLQAFHGVSSGSFAAPQHDYPSLLEIILTATDDHGLQASTTVYLYPKSHVLTFTSDPAGLTVTGGGASGPGPVQATFIEGTAISLIAPPLQTVAGTQYGFVSWSDTGAATHTVQVPGADQTYSARYIPDSRLAGPDRYGTSAAGAAMFPTGPAVAYVASGAEFPDAAAAAAIAAQQHAPLLLVQPGAIPASIATQLTRLKPHSIIVLGGAAAVSATVFGQLGAYTSPTAGQVSRAQGTDRFQTAANLATTTFPGGVGTVYVVNGLGFADAISAAPLAALNHAPVLYVEPNAVPASVATALGVLKPANVVIVGGTAAVSDAVKAALGAFTTPTGQVTRTAGADRYATAAQVALQVAAGGHPVGVYVASGLAFPDAITAAVVAGSLGDPVLLARSGLPLPPDAAAAMATMKPQSVVVVGGTLVISDAVLIALPAASAP